ncbi:MAG: MASE3 domain-containing protein [Phycisphaerae bacterium]
MNPSSVKSDALLRWMPKAIAAVFLSLLLYVLSTYSFLLFHSLAEMFAVAVAVGIFLIGWNSRRYSSNQYLFVLSVSAVFWGMVNLLHTLAYKGMGVFPDTGANLATQLWIACQYLMGASFLIAPLFVGSKHHPIAVLVLMGGLSAMLVGLIFAGWFPVCYVEGEGLTLFKKVSEYVICTMLVGGMVLLHRFRHHFEVNVRRWLYGALGLLVVSELAFTYYVSVYGLSNFVGHILRVGAFYYVYKAIIETGLRHPYDLLFRDLAAAQQRVRMATEAGEISIWSVDLLTGEEQSDGHLEQMLGYWPGGLGTAPWWDLATPPNERLRVHEYWNRAIETGHAEGDLECQMLTRDGEVHWFSTRVTVVCDEDGTPVQLLGVARNITQRRQAEEQNLQLERQVQHAQKLESLGVLAGGIAHDFNNILTGVLGHAEVLLVTLPDGSPFRNSADNIRRSALRAADLTRQMLAYSGRAQFVQQALDLNQMVRDMLELLEWSIDKHARLTLAMGRSLPSFQGDASQISQIILNLVTNASEAIGAAGGSIVVTTRVQRLDDPFGCDWYGDAPEPGEYLCLEVRDNGCGMDAETKMRLFEPFYTTKFTGRGLGLAAVQGIVRGHGGAVELESEEGVGSTFRVYLPTKAERVASSEPAAPRRSRQATRGTVLVIDDEKVVRDLVRNVLQRGGLTVVEAESAEDGIALLRSRLGEVDALLLDMTLPGMNGAEALNEIRAFAGDIPVVITSGYSQEEVTAAFGTLGICGFLPKPLSIDQLTETLSSAVRSVRLADDTESATMERWQSQPPG